MCLVMLLYESPIGLLYLLLSLILKYLFEIAVVESSLLPMTSILVVTLRGHGFHTSKSVMTKVNQIQIKCVVMPTLFYLQFFHCYQEVSYMFSLLKGHNFDFKDLNFLVTFYRGRQKKTQKKSLVKSGKKVKNSETSIHLLSSIK